MNTNTKHLNRKEKKHSPKRKKTLEKEKVRELFEAKEEERGEIEKRKHPC